jgi:hypothetical protein
VWTPDTLKSCAGIPTRTEQLNSRTALYSYENKYERTGGAQAAVNYTGDNDDMIGKEGICAPIFRGCLRAQEKAGRAHAANQAN